MGPIIFTQAKMEEGNNPPFLCCGNMAAPTTEDTYRRHTGEDMLREAG